MRFVHTTACDCRLFSQLRVNPVSECKSHALSWGICSETPIGRLEPEELLGLETLCCPLGGAVHASIPSNREVETGGLYFRGQPWLSSEYQVSHAYMEKLCFQNFEINQ